MDRFVRLQSLSVSHFDSIDMFNNLIRPLTHLQNFTHLNIRSSSVLADSVKCASVIDAIWKLPCLLFLHLKSAGDCVPHFSIPIQTSQSLEELQLINISLRMRDALHLATQTSNLQSLQISIVGSPSQSADKFPTMYRITSLTLVYQGSWANLTMFLQAMPNLTRLIIKAQLSIDVDGHWWEHFITMHLPKLRVFRFFFQYTCRTSPQIELRRSLLLDSFESMFWLDKYASRVCCDWNSNVIAEMTKIYLYTVPYISNHYYNDAANPTTRHRRHYPITIDDRSYKQVSFLIYADIAHSNLHDLQLQLSNVQHLCLQLPYDNQFPSIVPRLDRLLSLE